MEGILGFLSTGAIFLVVVAIIGVVFYMLDQRLKAWLARPIRCSVCGAELGRERPIARPPLCPSCATSLPSRGGGSGRGPQSKR